MQKEFIESTLELTDFIADSPSCFHVVENACSILSDAGFDELDEKRPYKIEPSKAYFVRRNSSSLIAFRLPQGKVGGLSIISAHTDSPCFKIKENPEITNGDLYTTLNVEAYGGMLLAPWFDRALSVAGRAFVKSNGQIEERLVNIDKDLCVIPNLCIHQNRDVNKSHEYKVQSELLPLISQGGKRGALKTLVASVLEVEESDIVDTELFLYNRDGAKIFGLDDEFFTSPKIDDLMCAFSALKALISSKASEKIQMVVLFDNEEVGSLTKQGANGDFLRTTLDRVFDALKMNTQEKYSAIAQGFMLSADNGHSLHPNYQQMCDPSNKPVMNGGVLIKFAGNQKYTTDGYSSSVLRMILEQENIPYQVFHNNSNVSGGSTLGNISQSQISLPTVDIGAAQLAMHSPNETAGTMDTYYLTQAMQAFLEKN